MPTSSWTKCYKNTARERHGAHEELLLADAAQQQLERDALEHVVSA